MKCARANACRQRLAKVGSGLQCANIKKAAGKGSMLFPARSAGSPPSEAATGVFFLALLRLRRRARRLGCTRRPGSTRRTRSPGRSARCWRLGCRNLEGFPALRAFLGAHVIAHIVALHANPRAHRRRCWSETHGSSILISLALRTCRPWRSRRERPGSHQWVEVFRVVVQNHVHVRLEYAEQRRLSFGLLGEPPVVLHADDSRIDRRRGAGRAA